MRGVDKEDRLTDVSITCAQRNSHHKQVDASSI